jgi:hypothetical protein
MLLMTSHPLGQVFEALMERWQDQIPDESKQKNMCVYGHSTDPIFQPPFLSAIIRLIFASDPINFYTEFG